jgi:glycosyltransferase involved in cell wall biosynthesis
MNSLPTFEYNTQYFGGTESMAKGFIEYILPEMTNIKKYYSVVIPGKLPEIETVGATGDRYIFWLHNTIVQFHPVIKDILTNAAVRRSTEKIVAVSQYERKVLSEELAIDLEKIYVIPNAIKPIVPTPGKFNNIDKVKIVHASAAQRGMELLLDAIPFMQEDFELNVFNDFYPDLPHTYNLEAVNDPRVNFYGKTPRKTLHKFFADAHIHAYPSTYPETSCLTQMEALSAGCYSVHTELGALPETSLGHGTMIPIHELTPEKYAEELDNTIRMIRQNGYDYEKQVKDIHANFTWEVAKNNWLAFDATI